MFAYCDYFLTIPDCKKNKRSLTRECTVHIISAAVGLFMICTLAHCRYQTIKSEIDILAYYENKKSIYLPCISVSEES